MSADLTLADRVAALEDYQLTVSDLPLKDLFRALETRWRPTADLLEPGSLSLGTFGDVEIGVSIVHFGGTFDSSTTTVGHALGAAPSVVLPEPTQLPGVESFKPFISNKTSTSFDLQCTTNSGVGYAGNILVPWLALK